MPSGFVILAALTLGQVEEVPAPPNEPSQTDRWQLEVLKLTNGQTLRGLLLRETATTVEFVTVTRRRRGGMSSVLIGLPRTEVDEIIRLPDAQRAVLLRQYQRFKSRVPILADKLNAVKLGDVLEEGVHYRTYKGHWFLLQSTADAEMTRRCVVRIEQIFRAYRQLLPPRVETGQLTRQVTIRLFGSTDEYQTYLQKHGVGLRNPAFYSAARNTIVAGGNLSAFSARLAKARRETQIVRQNMKALNVQFTHRHPQRERALRASGLSEQAIKEEQTAARRQWKSEFGRTMRRLEAVDRRNASQFVEVTQHMFRRLYHEAFHAYLQTYVYPDTGFHVPDWLNEGLAQVCESSRLEDGRLQLHAPDFDRLNHYYKEQLGPPAATLANLLLADRDDFVETHANVTSGSEYNQSWALAYYLTFHQNLLNSDQLSWYVSREAGRMDPIRRFERLVGRPIGQFAEEWHDAMRSMVAAPGVR